MAVRTRQAARVIDGVHTEVVCQAFADRILVLITQLGKVGCLTQVSLPSNAPLPPPIFAPASPAHGLPSLPPPPPSLLVQPLLGVSPEPTYDAYAAQVGTIVVFGLGDGEELGQSRGDDQGDDDEAGAGGDSRRPVVVGLALKKNGAAGRSAQDDTERRRFGNIMSMVLECRVW